MVQLYSPPPLQRVVSWAESTFSASRELPGGIGDFIIQSFYPPEMISSDTFGKLSINDELAQERNLATNKELAVEIEKPALQVVSFNNDGTAVKEVRRGYYRPLDARTLEVLNEFVATIKKGGTAGMGTCMSFFPYHFNRHSPSNEKMAIYMEAVLNVADRSYHGILYPDHKLSQSDS